MTTYAVPIEQAPTLEKYKLAYTIAEAADANSPHGGDRYSRPRRGQRLEVATCPDREPAIAVWGDPASGQE